MTIKVSFYHSATGIFHPSTLNTDAILTGATVKGLTSPDGFLAILGSYDRQSQRVDLTSGEVIDYQPPSPSVDHQWNAGTKRWQLKPEVATRKHAVATAKLIIAQLEAAQLRPLRELALDSGDMLARSKVIDIDQQIAAQRAIIRANTPD